MKRILLVSKKGKSKDMLVQLLQSELFSQIETIDAEEDASALLETNEFDLVIVNSPLEGKTGVDLAVYAAEKHTAGVLLAVQNKYANAIAQKVEPYGILVVGKPIVKAFFDQAVKFTEVTAHRVQSLKEENISLQLKLEELKIINRAKCVLIQHLSMSEVQAHKYIEKQAMDLRLPKARVAKQILKVYEQDGLPK
ncbi:MAG: response regulator [Eubacteriales bacterium]|nr:response regulator [Eubacteriales bacterium]